ncbi:conserved hypothetical protein [Culex quinquefasciatus]|uniref:Uncharacterized protein n=1 Tax=Culex quinquefasciatus TaxID=7176 RepID=B0WTW0_CULQU|nr:conserved hypothetical protein [Culex quinquefasciatus]|eukprot:XP_001856120.1 conserved hypothetical protein [Culex quinquefasciatus]
MSARSGSAGSPTYRILSRRPGRSTAGSTMSGRLVAAIRNTPFRSSMPSISVSSWLTTRIPAPPSALSDRFGHSESNSSKKMTHGAELRARWKHCRTARSDSPTYCLTQRRGKKRDVELLDLKIPVGHSSHLDIDLRRRSSGPFTEIKLIPASFATAFASSVFPQPGGPHSNTPDGALSPSIFNRWGNFTGARMASFNSSRMSPSDPMSFQVTSGTVMKPSRLAEG